LLALVPAVPAWTWWNGVLGDSPEAASALKRFDLGVFLDVIAGKGINGFGLLVGAAAAAGIVAAVSGAFAFGGILEVFGSEEDRRPFMHRFFRGGGHFFWRFFRLAIMAGVCLLVATAAASALLTVVTTPIGESEWEPAGYLAGIVSIAVTIAVAALFLLALDYARIRVARDDSRSMLKAYASGIGFVLRRLFTVYGIAVAILVLEIALILCYVAYETNAPAAGTWAAIGVLFVIQQVVVLGRLYFRVAMIGAERVFYEKAQPAPAVAVVEPSRVEPPVLADLAGPEAQPTT
jgi:MFS family permease